MSEQIVASIAEQIRKHCHIRGLTITVATEGEKTVATLQGRANTYYHKQIAQHHTMRALEGALTVNNIVVV